ncbi:hypothetical protein Elgi_33460 [Paenibacillus elgii]|nr:hypothetical protein Elgi_33460 [Paenibacillus elgii]
MVQRAAAAVTLRFASTISAFVLPGPCEVAKKQEAARIIEIHYTAIRSNAADKGCVELVEKVV